MKTTFTEAGAVLTKCTPTANVVFVRDFSATPDLAQTLVVTCALLGRAFRFTGLASLHIKETDRIAALQNELRQFGIVLHTPEHGTLEFTPAPQAVSDLPPKTKSSHSTATLRHPTIHTYDDHRMAMCFSLVALLGVPVTINDPQCTRKTFPDYFAVFESLTA